MSAIRPSHILLSFLVTCVIAQHDPYGQRPYTDRPQQYDRNNPYDRDRQYDRPGQGLSDRERYDRIDRNRSDPYGQPNPYDRDRYDQGQYDRNRTNPYGQQYPYDRNLPDPHSPYGQNRTNPYGQGQPYDRDNRYGQGGQPGQPGQYDPRYGAHPQGQDDPNCCEDYCYRSDRDQYVRFGPVTSYQAVAGKHQITQDSSQCKPILFWSLNKHGTSYPNQEILQRMRTLIAIRDEILKNYDRQTYPYRGRLCPEDYELLKNWRLDDSVTHVQGNELTPDAKEELRLLARRFQNKYRELLSVPYSETHYRFKYSSADRTYDSYQAYLEGLFNNQAFSVHAEIESDDASRGYRSCYGGYGSSSSSYSSSSSNPYDPNSQRYGSSGSNSNNPTYGSGYNSGYNSNNPGYNSNNPGSYSGGQAYNPNSGYNPVQGGYSSSSGYNTGSNYNTGGYGAGGSSGSYGSGGNPNRDYEYNQFKKNPEYSEMVRHVFRRLGYANYIPNENVVEDMYNMCRYETAWRPNLHDHAWCTVFNKKQLQVLEYAQDLREYFSNGYGNEDYSNRIGCGILSDMYRKFQRAIDGYTSDPKVIVNFGTAGAIENLLVAMSMAKDYTPLSAQNYYSQTQRKWRTATLSPFSANLVAVLYQCDSSSRDMYKVMFYLNENPMDFPECNQGLCSWETIRTKYEDVVNRCDYCGGSSRLHLHLFSLLTTALAILIFRY